MQWSDYFYYDETSPTCLRWRVDILAGRKQSSVIMQRGDVAGGLKFDKKGKKTCCAVKLRGRVFQVHRIIWEMFVEDIPGKKEIDHLDGNPHNNVLSNLFCKTKKGNARNRKQRIDNKTGVTGVSYCQTPGKESYVASWMTEDGKYKNNRFSVSKYGKDEAFKLAVNKRKEKLMELNKITQDDKYTERHGTGAQP